MPHYKPAIKEKFKARLGEALQALPSVKVDWSRPNHDPRDAYNTSKVALIIEPRPLPHLVPHILHMLSIVPPEWKSLVIGSNASVVSIGRAYAIKYQQAIGKLDLMVLPEPWNITSKEHVFRTLTDARFYDEFLPGVEWILKYESDSILCANADTSLNSWLDWSWVGAPRTFNDKFPGNGGLSLRRVSAIQQVLAFQARYNDSEPEDEWFSKRVYLLPGAKVASPTDQALSVEDTYFPGAMGFHVRDGGRTPLNYQVWGDAGQRKEIFNHCPELSMIMDMKLERERCYDGLPSYQPTINQWQDDAAKATVWSDQLEQSQEEWAAQQETAQEATELDADGAKATSVKDNGTPVASPDAGASNDAVDHP